tara:strand:+ start:1035 stop:1271 length:237 start_codon:yes stop_codon:yes gene_type:complete
MTIVAGSPFADSGIGEDVVGDLIVTGDITSAAYKLAALNTAPASASAVGDLGEIRYTADYIYVCIATNTWKRTALTTW